MTTQRLAHARGALELGRCLVMGILNRTPDSFYDGGRLALDDAVAHGMRLAEDGADVIDVGAVKAGPGSGVDEREELARLVPLVEALARRVSVPLSVETARPRVARLAIDAGAVMVNDVTGLADAGLATICGRTGAALVLMHTGGQIRGRPRHPRYDDVVADVIETWRALARVANDRGVARDQIVVDPGLDFGKTTYHSLELMRRLDELVAEGWPVLVAPSRKDVVGETLALLPEERLEGTLALVSLAAASGAAFVRVHDVAPSARAVAMAEAVAGRTPPSRAVRGLWG